MIKLLTVATGLGFAVAAGVAQETVAPNFPRVSINNGAETAMLLDAVYLTIGYQDGRPTEYRVSEGVGFLEAFAVWRPVPANASATSFRVIHPAPNGRFAAPAAFKQVFVQLRNAAGTARTNLDSINVHQEYDLEPGLALDEARSTGFAFSSTPSGCVQRRSLQDSRQVILF